MIKAIGIINSEKFLTRPLRQWMDERAEESGVEIDWRVVTANDRGDYKPWFRECDNVISWGYKMPHSWMTKLKQNVLYIENTLVRQDMGIFVDHRGWFSDSNLSQSSVKESAAHIDLEFIAREWFGWQLGSGGNPRGSIVVCLQTPRDASVRYHFPNGRGVAPHDMTDHVLRILHDNLPTGVPILIRPHPKKRDEFKPAVWRYDWTLDVEGSLSARLPQCSAMVTVNSTCASEAALLGLPVATLGCGGFTGQGVTLECHSDPAKLKELLNWRPQWRHCEEYLRKVMGSHFMSYEKPHEWPCAEFQSWLEACIIKTTAHFSSQPNPRPVQD